VNSNCDLKICDFGLSRINIVGIDKTRGFTKYVATRRYRAPELLFKLDYNEAADMWSTGTIVAEMFKRGPLFVSTDCNYSFF
jgi:mitogen-activated protein kinase 1/3